MNEEERKAGQLHSLTTLHLFGGIGGGIYADLLLGHRCVGAVEIEKYRRKVLRQRQKDGIFPWFPIFRDVRTFSGIPWRGKVGILSGGFPCQGVSSAGKGMGVNSDPRSGLWYEYQRIIGEIEPPFVFIENSPLLTSRGLDEVLRGLASHGYSARWLVLGAWHLGARHKRDRIWIFAYSTKSRYSESKVGISESPKSRLRSRTVDSHSDEERRQERDTSSSIEVQGLLARSFVAATNDRRRTDTNTKQDGRTPKSKCTRSREMGKETCGVGKEGNQLATAAAGVRQSQSLLRALWDAESRVARIADGIPNAKQRIEALGDAQVPTVAATAFRILSDDLIPR